MKKFFLGGVIGVVAIIGLAAIFSHNKAPAAKPIKTHGLYVSLGDSVAAGVGLAGDSDSSACDRTNQSYPKTVAKSMQYELKSFACSGASVTAGIAGKQEVNQLSLPPQLEQLFAQPKPALVSITIGANDAHWTTVIAKCYTGECGTEQDQATASSDIASAKEGLHATLEQIKQHYGTTPPRVVVTGYHQVFPTQVSADCTDLAGIDAAELQYVRQLQTDISTAAQQASQGFDFVTYAPISFSGHELCTADSWVQGLSEKQPYHPTAAGQNAFARDIITAVKTRK